MKSAGLILLAGLPGSRLSKLPKLPEVVSIMLCGILIGPFALNLLDENVLSLSGAIRSIAFTIILLKAGITLRFDDLKRIGSPVLPHPLRHTARAQKSRTLLDRVKNGLLPLLRQKREDRLSDGGRIHRIPLPDFCADTHGVRALLL